VLAIGSMVQCVMVFQDYQATYTSCENRNKANKVSLQSNWPATGQHNIAAQLVFTCLKMTTESLVMENSANT